jgi:NitT/TauT family transport system substrate-binding protein
MLHDVSRSGDGPTLGLGPRRPKRTTAQTGAVVGVTALCLSMVSACGSGGGHSSSSEASATTSVTIAANTSVVADLEPLLAQDAGYFKKVGLKVSVVNLSASALLASLASGRVQFGALGAPQPEIAAMSGAPVKWVGVWSDKSTQQLIAQPGITSLAQLAHKSIGITTAGSTTDIYARLAVESAGLNPTEVTFQPVQSASALAAAFAGGSIDATAISPPSSTASLQSRPGSRVLVNFANGNNYPWWQGLVAYMPWADSHRAATTKVLEAIAMAVKLYRDDPEKAKSLISTTAKVTDPTQLQEAYVTNGDALVTSSIVPSPAVERFILTTLSTLYPGKYPDATAANAGKYFDDSFATAAMKAVGSING